MKSSLAVLAFIFCTMPAVAQQYTISDLGNLGGDYAIPERMNALGEVVGQASLPGNYPRHAFLYSNGHMTDLGTLGGDNSVARDIDDSGAIVGDSEICGPALGCPSGGISNAFLYANGTMANLLPDDNLTSSANAVSGGQITGWRQSPPSSPGYPELQAFVYSNGQILYIDRAVGNDTNGTDSIGTEQVTPIGVFPFVYEAFLYGNGVKTDIGGAYSSAVRINAKGAVMGERKSGVFVYSNGVLTDLGLPPGCESVGAVGMNSSGQIVGNAAPCADGRFNMWLYTPGTGFVDLTTRIPSDSGVNFLMDINDVGQILGFDGCRNGQCRGFLLTPISPYKALVRPPIAANGKSTFPAHRGALPVKFTLTENNAPTCDLPAATIAVTRTSGATPLPIGVITYGMPSDNGSNFRIDPTACQYIYNLAASALGVGTYRVDISINGFVVGSATFALQ